MASSFGLDIGNSSIKAVHLEKKGDMFALLAAGVTASPSPGLASQNEKDLIAVADAITLYGIYRLGLGIKETVLNWAAFPIPKKPPVPPSPLSKA